MENKEGIMSACRGSAVGGEKVSKTKSINFSAANNGWHWHAHMIFVGHGFVLEKTF